MADRIVLNTISYHGHGAIENGTVAMVGDGIQNDAVSHSYFSSKSLFRRFPGGALCFSA